MVWKKLTIFLGWGLLLVFGLATPLLVLAIGVTPAVTTAPGLTAASRVERTVRISRTKADKPLLFSVTAEGAGAKYIELPQAQFTMNPGEQNANYSFVIAPKNAANGEYKALLRILGGVAPKESGGAGGADKVVATVSVVAGVVAEVMFSVTDQQIKVFTIKQAYIEESEVGAPFLLTFDIANEGNVDARPDKIGVEAVDITDNTNRFEETILAVDLPYTAPLTRQFVKVPVAMKLSAGDYWVRVAFYDGERVVFEEAKMFLRMHPPGTLAQKVDFVDFSINGSQFFPSELAKFTFTVNNTGEVMVEPTAYVEIKQAGKTLDFLRSETKRIFKGQGTNYLLTYRPTERGEYQAEGYIENGVMKSVVKNVNFTVVRPGLGARVWWYGGGAAILLGGGYLAWRIRRQRKKDSASADGGHSSA